MVINFKSLCYPVIIIAVVKPKLAINIDWKRWKIYWSLNMKTLSLAETLIDYFQIYFDFLLPCWVWVCCSLSNNIHSIIRNWKCKKWYTHYCFSVTNLLQINYTFLQQPNIKGFLQALNNQIFLKRNIWGTISY